MVVKQEMEKDNKKVIFWISEKKEKIKGEMLRWLGKMRLWQSSFLKKSPKKHVFDGRFQTIPNSQLQQQPKYIRIVSSGNALATNSTPIKVATISRIISYALLQHLTIPILVLVLHPVGVVDVVDVVDFHLGFVQVLHTVPQQHLTTLVASPQHHAPATLSTGTRTIKVIYFSVITDLKSSLIVTFVA